jgi:hypothetical protein
MSIRNFDVLVEVAPETKEVVDVIGEPGNHSIMYEQHDPNYLEAHDHVIVADSENNRVVEYNETMEEVWRYEGPSTRDRLQWPRDADRLPNGDTLIVDSRNFRAIEVDENGDVVWAHDLSKRQGIIYDADRLGPNRNLDEEPEDVPAGDTLESRGHSGAVSNTVAFVESWLGFVFPPWFGLPGLFATLGILFGSIGLAWEGYRDYRDGA